MEHKIMGYARVSSKEQKLDRQLIELKKYVPAENIIMDKDAKLAEYEEELAELREFKAAVEKKELAAKVEATMAEVEECMSKEDCEKFRAEGMECDMASFDAWANKVKASCFEAVKKGAGKKDAMFSFSAPMNNNTEPKDIWDKL